MRDQDGRSRHTDEAERALDETRPGSPRYRGTTPGAPDGTRRDRDPAGRARNARPRDAYGRPLPRGAAGEEQVPDDYAAEPGESLAEAQRLLDADRPFHAHEVLEAAWKAAPEAERELWQGLAQLAVGFTHARRGNAHGAATLLRRAAERLAPYAGPTSGPPRAGAPYGIRAGALADLANKLADRVERQGLDAVTDADLAPRLRS